MVKKLKFKILVPEPEDFVKETMVLPTHHAESGIRSVILKNPEFNLDYIEKWLIEFDESLEENFLELFRKTLNSLYA
jgi:hypothetical protein